MSEKDKIVHIILEHQPNTQAIYLFGSHGTAEERKDSDVDIVSFSLRNKKMRTIL